MSSLRVVSGNDIRRLLPMQRCIELMEQALAALARGEAYVPLRTVMRMPDGSGVIALMPGHLRVREAALGLKAVTIFPGNAQRGIDTHQGAVVMFDAATGEVTALLDASSITAIRTAAVSGLATARLARKDAAELAILGAGVQAETHLEAISAVRNVKRARIWNRSRQRAEQLAERLASRHRFPLQVVDFAADCVRGADIICTVTASSEPVLSREWLKTGVHINAVGASVPAARELDSRTVVDASLFVDRRESALNESGDVLIPMGEGLFGPEHIKAELGEVLIGAHPGRTSEDEITVFKSLGLSVEDVAAGDFLVRQAEEDNAGRVVEL